MFLIKHSGCFIWDRMCLGTSCLLQMPWALPTAKAPSFPCFRSLFPMHSFNCQSLIFFIGQAIYSCRIFMIIVFFIISIVILLFCSLGFFEGVSTFFSQHCCTSQSPKFLRPNPRVSTEFQSKSEQIFFAPHFFRVSLSRLPGVKSRRVEPLRPGLPAHFSPRVIHGSPGQGAKEVAIRPCHRTGGPTALPLPNGRCLHGYRCA